MNGTRRFILAIAVAFFLIPTAVCIATSATRPLLGQAIVHIPAVSIKTTPVKYDTLNNGVILGYREFGSATSEPLLMIEGFKDTMENWNDTFIGVLATKYHVFIYDHRGIGHSRNNPNADMTISMYAQDACGIISRFGMNKRMHVYGASMGSSIAQQLAIDHSGCVLKLILDSNNCGIDSALTPKLNKYLAKDTSASTPPGIRQEALACFHSSGTWNDLPKIKKDVMLVVGTIDSLTPDTISVLMAGQIKGSWLVRFKGLGHTGFHRAPVQYGQNALNFLEMDESPLH